MYERKDRWTVGEWMTDNPHSVTPETSVKRAFYRMRHEGFRHLPVVDDDGKLVGIVTDRDLRRPDISDDPDGWNDYYRLDNQTEVRHVMTEKVETLSTTDTVERAVELFVHHKFGALPVLDKRGDLIGILTSHDLLRALGQVFAEAGDELRKE